MSARAEVVVVKEQPVPPLPVRRTEALLPGNPTAKALEPVVDLTRLEKSGSWYQKFGARLGAMGPLDLGIPAVGGAVGAQLVVHGQLLGIIPAIIASGIYVTSHMGRMHTAHDNNWARERSEQHLRAWLKEQWGIEPKPNAFKDKDLRKLVNGKSTKEYTFAAVDGTAYKLSRHAAGADVVLTNAHNKELPRTRAARVAAAEKLSVAKFNAEGQQVAEHVQKLLAQLRAMQLSPEQQHVVERSGRLLADASDLAERIVPVAGVVREQVFEQLTTTLRAAEADLEQVAQEQLDASLSEVEVLARYAQAVTSKRSSHLELPPTD